MGYPHNWMVYFMENHSQKWMMKRGTLWEETHIFEVWIVDCSICFDDWVFLSDSLALHFARKSIPQFPLQHCCPFAGVSPHLGQSLTCWKTIWWHLMFFPVVDVS